MSTKHTLGALTMLQVLTEQTWPDFSQIRYLLCKPLTHPIYVLSGGFSGDSPIANDITGCTWLCLSHLILVSQSATRVTVHP